MGFAGNAFNMRLDGIATSAGNQNRFRHIFGAAKPLATRNFQ